MSNNYVNLPLETGSQGAGVESLNGLDGNLNIIAGNNISIQPSGDSIEISVTGDVAVEYTQAVAATQWVINHNLGHHVFVCVFDNASEIVTAQVSNPSINQTIIDFNYPTAGYARLL